MKENKYTKDLFKRYYTKELENTKGKTVYDLFNCFISSNFIIYLPFI